MRFAIFALFASASKIMTPEKDMDVHADLLLQSELDNIDAPLENIEDELAEVEADCPYCSKNRAAYRAAREKKMIAANKEIYEKYKDTNAGKLMKQCGGTDFRITWPEVKACAAKEGKDEHKAHDKWVKGVMAYRKAIFAKYTKLSTTQLTHLMKHMKLE